MSDKEMSNRLRRAVYDGDLKTIQRLLKGGVDVNSRFWYESTLLHEAVSMDNADLVEMLIKAGANVNSTNKDGRTALHLACRGGNAEIVGKLIAAGCDVNKRTLDGKSCLHVAAWRGHEEVIRTLVKEGADVNIQDAEGCPPLYWAARSNHLNITQTLVEAGAKINYKVKDKWPPLQAALHHGHTTVARYLILQGAETNVSIQNKNVLSLMISNKSIPQQGIQEMMELLVQAGYNLHRTSWTSSTVQSSTISKKTCLDLSQKLADSPEQFLSTWLDRTKLCIPSLAQLCRARIRKRLNYCNCGRSIVRSLTFLPIPALLMDFLSLRDEPSLKLN
ncbi:hypothetical protein C0Q70_02044 [Pomacea canaliculata]|uniref:SOCS box domain-containing protein n=1 Tax=Pomacea canaliculata TaxID=400727 RepID=A0A2T7Q161_POMCA|nr:26S proteasome non-ATPase regulatory subunit 10-like [Pomacea canaliculata]PVD39414.1 hypothetical protein C0Q70_02044 [Pomacea canaliculata]